jgi:hypothetical protein
VPPRNARLDNRTGPVLLRSARAAFKFATRYVATPQRTPSRGVTLEPDFGNRLNSFDGNTSHKKEVTIVGVQTLVVFVGLAIALLVGILVGTLEVSVGPVGWLIIGTVPVVWGLLYVTERLIGRPIWHYTAPYPYRWMEDAAVSEASRLQTAPERGRTRESAEEIRLAA